MTGRVWLIFHRATVSPVSPINMDGSEFVIGVAVVPALTEDQAMLMFQQYLTHNHMTLLELHSVVNFDSENYRDSDNFSHHIVHAVEGALRRNLVYYVAQASSETLKYDQDGAD